VVAACAVLTVGCSTAGPGPRACTEIGSPAGVSVTVARDVVAPAMELTLRICQDACRVERVDLMPGSVTVDETCHPDLPDGSCSASSSPDGTMVGFVDVGDLTAGEVRIRGELASGGSSRTRFEEVTVLARATYPNGRDCAAGGPQASIQVTRAGLR
jgi:hypothetical protein